MFTQLRFPTVQQSTIWLKRKQKISPSEIAQDMKVSRPFVSKATRIAEARIRRLLENAASINRIKIHHISEKYGLIYGYSPSTQSETYITFSPSIGVQTWYKHQGDCSTCSEYEDCNRMLLQIAEEWDVQINEEMVPTELSDFIFNTIMRRLKWK
ncbi:MAG: hypothetical protein ACTSV2_09025 [Candidatus Thorarchaeota archaeon]